MWAFKRRNPCIFGLSDYKQTYIIDYGYHLNFLENIVSEIQDRWYLSPCTNVRLGWI